MAYVYKELNSWILLGIFIIFANGVNSKMSRRLSFNEPGPYKVPSGPQAFCRPCDARKCPQVYPNQCPGKVIKDECGCCPVCDVHGETPSMNAADAQSNLTCSNVACPGREMCILNIQGIPMCRCPSVFVCRQKRRKEICAEDGNTYRSRCYLRIAECIQNRKIRMIHLGPCREKNQNPRSDIKKHILSRKNRRFKGKRRRRKERNERRKRDHNKGYKTKRTGKHKKRDVYRRWLERQN